MNDLFPRMFSHPSIVGFDRLFKSIAEHQDLYQKTSYPPYNIVKDGNKYTIEMALAGLSKDDLDIVLEDGSLKISYESESDSQDYVHKGVAMRSFTRSFKLAEDIAIEKAILRDGLLCIELEKIIPDDKKPVKIEINN